MGRTHPKAFKGVSVSWFGTNQKLTMMSVPTLVLACSLIVRFVLKFPALNNLI